MLSTCCAKKLITTDLIDHWCLRMVSKYKSGRKADNQIRSASIEIPVSALSSTFLNRSVLRNPSRKTRKLGPRALTAARKAKSRHSQNCCCEWKRSDPVSEKNGLSGASTWGTGLGFRKINMGRPTSLGGPPPLFSNGVAVNKLTTIGESIYDNHTGNVNWQIVN